MKYLNPTWNRPDAFEKNREAELDDNVAIPLAEIELDHNRPNQARRLFRAALRRWPGNAWESASAANMVKPKIAPYALLLLRRYSGVFDALSGGDR